MFTARLRPPRHRGANCYAAATATIVTVAACAYTPPGGGALVSAFSCDAVCYFGVAPASQLAALGFTVAGSTDLITPEWGDLYALTGSFQGGRLSAVPIFYNVTPGNPQSLEFLLLPGNVFLAGLATANLPGGFALHVHEFPTAEELERWNASSGN